MIGRDLIEELRSGQLLVPDFLAQVEARFIQQEPSVLAFLPDEKRFDRLYDEAEALILAYPDLIQRPLMFGALLGVKDIFHVEGFSTQAGSRLPSEVFQGTEAKSVSRLLDAGALFFGKTVTTEFAYFSPGPTRNPHDSEHTPGGSSSGSAAAVAAGFCHIALGTQTIGSIIRPASFCGVVGVKPTYDRISRAGVIPLSPSLDHVGFFVPDVESAVNGARVLYTDWDEPTQPLKKPRLGIPEGPYMQSVSQDSLAHFERVYKLLEEAGYELQRIQAMPGFKEIQSRHDVILSAEAAAVHADWFGEHEDLYSSKLTDLIRRGQSVTHSQLQTALAERDTFRADMRRTFLDHNIDIWIAPSTTGPAPKGLDSTGDPVMNLPWTQAGLPAMNLPAGKSQEGLPLGLQIVGNWYKDESLLFWAKDLEKVLRTL
ncbi:MAG TPA: amidase [Anaerolineales bacterium]|jgi:Asp-tRNA(Asn)/Glu-tRNA(Gln) amidotransferase A subunit family amidase|nr:amidase [Anaerolineales bacterium]